MDTPKYNNKMDKGVATTPKSKLAKFEVLVAYPGYEVGDIVQHDPNASAVLDNVANGIWKKL